MLLAAIREKLENLSESVGNFIECPSMLMVALEFLIILIELLTVHCFTRLS